MNLKQAKPPAGLRRGILCLLAACALLTVWSRTAAAQYFQYETTIDITNVVPLQSGLVGTGTDNVTLTTAAGTPIIFEGFASFPDIGPDNLDASLPGTDIVYAIMDVNVVNASPLQALAFDFEFQLEIEGFDLPTGGTSQGTAIFDITGTLTGSLGAGRKVNLNSIMVNPIPSQVIGGYTYSLLFQPQHFTPPGPIFPGAFGIHVTAVLVPEPSTLTLFGLGTLVLATPVLRRLGKSRRGGT
jgi:hypothetical protein